jgi:hypothetical protein
MVTAAKTGWGVEPRTHLTPGDNVAIRYFETFYEPQNIEPEISKVEGSNSKFCGSLFNMKSIPAFRLPGVD